jgi:hypothetical protein
LGSPSWIVAKRWRHAPQLTQDIIDAAIEGLENQKRRIDAQIAELRTLGTKAEPESAAKRPRRKMSAAARKAIGEAQRKRWAASKGQATEAKAPAKRKTEAERGGHGGYHRGHQETLGGGEGGAEGIADR